MKNINKKKDITCIFDFDKRNVHLYLDNYKNNEEVINKLESVIYELQNKIILYAKCLEKMGIKHIHPMERMQVT